MDKIMLNSSAVARGIGVLAQNLLRDHPSLNKADAHLPGTKADNLGAPLWNPETIITYCSEHGIKFDVRNTYR